MIRIYALILACMLCFAGIASAQAPEPVASPSDDYDWDVAGQILVQHGARVKPLDTFARELVKMIYADDNYNGEHPVETYFHWMADGDYWMSQPLIYLSKDNVRKEMGLMDHEGNYFTLGELQGHPELRRLVMEGMTKEDNGEKLDFTHTKAGELMNRLSTLSAVFNHTRPLMVPLRDGDPLTTWMSMPELLNTIDHDSTSVTDDQAALSLAFAGMYHSLHDDRPDIFNTSAAVFVNSQLAMLKNHPEIIERSDLEIAYNHLAPFNWARLLLAIAIIFYLLSLRGAWAKVKPVALVSTLGGIAFYSIGMIMRWQIGGRAPWSNMYESLLATGWSLLIVSLIFELVRRDRIFGLAGSVMGSLILGIAAYASLDRGINPLVPALQSYWLTYHVIIILSSYGCLALSMIVGHGVLIQAVRSKGKLTDNIKPWNWANLKIMQLGSVLLILGILLGAVWANVSWGRFWGWDPKETWALITWFVYIVILHGRSAGWLQWRGLAAMSVGVFPIVIMTYYGVNFYLSGLHSYGAGSSPGIPHEAYAYLAVEALFLGWVFYSLRGTWGRPPRKSPPAAKAKIPPRIREAEVQEA